MLPMVVQQGGCSDDEEQDRGDDSPQKRHHHSRSEPTTTTTSTAPGRTGGQQAGSACDSDDGAQSVHNKQKGASPVQSGAVVTADAARKNRHAMACDKQSTGLARMYVTKVDAELNGLKVEQLGSDMVMYTFILPRTVAANASLMLKVDALNKGSTTCHVLMPKLAVSMCSVEVRKRVKDGAHEDTDDDDGDEEEDEASELYIPDRKFYQLYGVKSMLGRRAMSKVERLAPNDTTTDTLWVNNAEHGYDMSVPGDYIVTILVEPVQLSAVVTVA
eukprot:TRINITY_DN14682_c0_g1_i1.p1 TRINITY_DN14682_c0_g1~~TRINITY_DN14682_c0_g1_i1.p1  ORF type:complete len:274 (+),score=63.52 TRINITY_DN14682_c0_g1_i1:127-948(+)